MSRLLFVALCLLLSPLPAASVKENETRPARKRVLQQIALPHHYYYREMYLPQVTSGPSGVAWFPDGRSLVVSMHGALWRHALGTQEAVQLTDGPGYAYEPDVSPDGTWIAYSSYRDDAIDLMLLDVETGESRSLAKNGAVNVEPRFSPNGRRLAFVSTAFEGRFHVFTLDLIDGRAAKAPIRLTEDRDSDLPRYYYSRFDHYLSPTWSPDGAELILVSNRGRIWGTGGLWRMKAQPAAPMRELRYEETTWKARPDWSPDGRRVVYASYLGRQWHQLWLMTAEGGDAFPLTYGEFDATAPRWSSDGSRIAYIVNEGGAPALEIVTVLGGEKARPVLAKRRYKNPVGRLILAVHDAGTVTPARVSISGPDGRTYAPDDAWRHADDAFVRGERRIEYAYFHAPGRADVVVPAHTPLSIEVSHGPEYRVFRREVSVPTDQPLSVDVALERIEDLPAKGWWSGDLHVHMNYGGAYRNDPAQLLRQAQAEDVHVVENLIVNKEQRIPDVSYFRGAVDPVSTDRFVVAHGQEFHTSYWGHLGLLGLAKNLLLPDYAGYVNTAAASLHPMNATVADQARSQEALVGYVHPWDAYPDPATDNLTNELPIDVALGKVDYYEVAGFVDDYLANSKVWYQLLNCGFRLPAGAGTDAMANYASLRGPVGLNRVFVKSGPKLEHRSWLAALKAGRTFATNGPLLAFNLDGREPGDEITLSGGGRSLAARVDVKSHVPIDRVEIIRNGAVVATVPVGRDGHSATAEVLLVVDQSGWYVLRAWSRRPRYPVLDVHPFASTSPIYVTVGGQPVRSPVDAAYFLAWIDRVAGATAAHQAWNTPGERTAVLARIAEARKVFAAMVTPK